MVSEIVIDEILFILTVDAGQVSSHHVTHSRGLSICSRLVDMIEVPLVILLSCAAGRRSSCKGWKTHLISGHNNLNLFLVLGPSLLELMIKSYCSITNALYRWTIQKHSIVMEYTSINNTELSSWDDTSFRTKDKMESSCLKSEPRSDFSCWQMEVMASDVLFEEKLNS